MPDRAQVIIRIVPGGGTKTLQQIINQLEYLSRKGRLELQRSARHLDIPLPPDQIHELARSWVQETGTYDESQPDEERQQELTTHIIVSFPAGTSQVAAYAASREWAAEMFGSGAGGGRYNYLTAFHIDRDHPHLHVVVNRRELLGHGWLKISRRHPQLNYDALRIKMAEISLRHGIALDASRRAERGITERPITYAQYRRLEREQARQIRFEDADLEQSSPQGDHPEFSQPFDTSPFEASAGGPEDMPRPNNRQNESQVHLQEPAGVSNEAGVLVRVALETERLAQPFVSETILADDIGSGSSRVAEGRVESANRTPDIPRAATEAATHTTHDRQRRAKRPHDDDGGPSGAKRVTLEGIAVGPQANAGEQDGSSGPLVRQAGTSRPSPPTATTRASTATDSLSATAHLQQRRGVPSKRPREDDDGEPSERKRERDERSKDGRGGNRR
ncbi:MULTISPECIES: T-DNA border endonuclease VirD2 [Hyphomicrobiales]|uniref:Type IV secretion system protein VirD n=7 Tax=Rhizobium/Agrobacterium group TaxID=227290 RepID=A0A2Z2PE93_RHIRH|nr:MULTISPECIES: T-DNA border endonuclease VirD2 [Rhizobium/Agrobacterium group]KAA6481489.1 T-DNA border endonuclease VirD2 [Agrobacterium sp. ICMP 7243]ARU12412.1 virulence protein VirD2 [Agrobacterium tumefaciens]ASK41143.1 type IV secretion system protein VirD [Rhizobium rhizogenes]ASK41306.1 type IV secretion system protein VirD [Agrobacterium tumefaciens]ASK41768.1 type IV secretion system protein VirD [Agrobacterium tumefaciens]